MIKITNLSLPVGADQNALLRKVSAALNLPKDSLEEVTILKQSIDARKKSDVRYIYTVGVSLPRENQILKYATGGNISLYQPQRYEVGKARRNSSLPPVVVGLGPAGLFAALYLARSGVPCIVLERGQDVDTRTKDVSQFWKTGKLNTQSNVQFGEGGAGTFSDGKLTTGTHDPRLSAVLDTFVAAGAPEDIRYSHKPHIGTDILRDVVKQLRQELLSLGCEVRFGHQLTGLQATGDSLSAIQVRSDTGDYTLPCDALVLAPGHSARDTFSMLFEAGVPMEQKNFAIGVRMEHLQSSISAAQYGPAWEQLPPSDYKLACHLPSGRSAFSFCACPGGQVVAAASEDGHLVTNGMSYRARDMANINGGLLVGVGPGDFGDSHPLSGIRFQQQWEQAAFVAGGRNFHAPVQRLEDFLKGVPSSGPGGVQPSYQPGVHWTSLNETLPGYVLETLREALPILNRKVQGFSAPDAVVTGVETRSSSPVRILRDDTLQSALRGVYPCGEGGGHAGGIVSAAVDGIRVAEAIANIGD